MTMDKKKIIGLCEQILAATDNIVSVGVMATNVNSPQLSGIQRSARLIVLEINKPEPEEVAADG